MSTTLTIGFTRTDRDADYIPAMDGWKPGAVQNQMTFTVDEIEDYSDLQIAEAVFIATNAPTHVIESSYLATRVHDAIVESPVVVESFFRSVSVGDTLVISGRCALTCQKVGWEVVA